MGIKTANDLFVSQMRDLYSVEKLTLWAYPKIVKAAHSEELKRALKAHLEETKGQMRRLDQVFEILDKKSSGKTCEVMKSLVDEAHDVLDEISKGPVLDAAIIAVSRRIEHQEIASYDTMAGLARALGQPEIHELLAATLQEEKDADERLNEGAEAIHAHFLPKTNVEALEAVDEEDLPTRKRITKKPMQKKRTSKAKKS